MITLYSTWPDVATAEAAARAALEQRLIACANIVSGAQSLYRWEGALRRDAEVVMFAKTTQRATAAAIAALQQEHPYDLPCIVAWPLQATLPAFESWVDSEVIAT